MNTTTKCKICGSTQHRYIGVPFIPTKFPRASHKDYRILQCKKCQYYHIDPEIDLTQEEWQQLYEDDYFAHANITEWQQQLHSREREERLTLIDSKMTIPKDKFLDMGCGVGYVLDVARQRGYKPYGVDIADNLKIEHKDVVFLQGNIFDAKFPDHTFSAIFMDSVLEHVMNPMETLTELYRIMKSGGVFFVVVPNEDSLLNSFSRFMHAINFKAKSYAKIKPFVHPYHVQGYNTLSLKTALQGAGFKDVAISTFGGNYTFWKAYQFGTYQYLLHLFTYPIGLISILSKNQIQLMGIATK